MTSIHTHSSMFQTTENLATAFLNMHTPFWDEAEFQTPAVKRLDYPAEFPGQRNCLRVTEQLLFITGLCIIINIKKTRLFWKLRAFTRRTNNACEGMISGTEPILRLRHAVHHHATQTAKFTPETTLVPGSSKTLSPSSACITRKHLRNASSYERIVYDKT
jgi:hypothetical protein